MRVIDKDGKFVGFFLSRWGRNHVKVLLAPGKSSKLVIKDIIDVHRLEKQIALTIVFFSKPSREKVREKIRKVYGDFTEEEYPGYLARYAKRVDIDLSDYLKINSYYVLFDKANITIREDYIQLLKPIGDYPEFELIKQIENAPIFGEKLRGFIGKVKGPIKIIARGAHSEYSYSVATTVYVPFTTGDATLTVIVPSYLALQFGDVLVVNGKRSRKYDDRLSPTSIYCLNRNILWTYE